MGPLSCCPDAVLDPLNWNVEVCVQWFGKVFVVI
jgi:hypothetical protein